MDHVYFEISKEKAPAELLNNRSNLVITERAKLLASAVSVLETQGYFDKGGVTIAAIPRPHLTLPFLDFLNSLELQESSIVELGAGQSTLYFQQRFKSVYSYETNADWIALLRPLLHANVHLSLEPISSIEACAITPPGHEWLLVDFAGKRTEFIKNLLLSRPHDSLPSYIVVDNSEWYRTGAGLLASQGYIEIPFAGLKSSQAFTSVTSLFLKRGCEPFKMKDKINPPYSLEINNAWDVIN